MLRSAWYSATCWPMSTLERRRAGRGALSTGRCLLGVATSWNRRRWVRRGRRAWRDKEDAGLGDSKFEIEDINVFLHRFGRFSNSLKRLTFVNIGST